MASLPVRSGQVRVAQFLAWLAENGAEIGKPTNPYEVVRYRAYHGAARKAVTHIIYTKENGLLTWTGGSMAHYRAFLEGVPLPSRAIETVPVSPPSVEGPVNATARRRKKIMERDGENCWFCAMPMGDDVTLEHLVPRSRGGGNDNANCVLAHAACNQAAANLSLSEKVELRAQMRGVPA